MREGESACNDGETAVMSFTRNRVEDDRNPKKLITLTLTKNARSKIQIARRFVF